MTCLLENWTSAGAVPFAWGAYSALASLGGDRKTGVGGGARARSRLVVRLGAAAALHQYPSLLLELRRTDRP